MRREQSDDARKALVVLVDALLLLESPRSWTRKGYALDGRGRQVRVDDPRARRYCTVGAVLRAEHLRNATPMAVATDPRPEVDDLHRPVAPDAPPHVGFALSMVGVAALEEIDASRLAIRRRDATDKALSLRHLPMLAGLRRDFGYAKAISMLARAIALTAELATTVEPPPAEAGPS